MKEQKKSPLGGFHRHVDAHSKILGMAEEPSQVELWSHFQTKHCEVFAQAKKRHRSLIRLAEKLSQGRSLLNIGCGDGFLEQTASAKSWDVISVDPNKSSVVRVRAMGVEARCGSIASLPVASESVHVVTCTEVLEHLTPETMAEGLKEIRRVLLPGGVLIGTVPYREDLHNHQVFCPHCRQTFHRWGHHQSFDEGKMRSVLGEYFSVLDVSPRYYPEWGALNWKGKLTGMAQCTLGFLGVYGVTAKLLFAATKSR